MMLIFYDDYLNVDICVLIILFMVFDDVFYVFDQNHIL